MTFPTGTIEIRECSDEELKTMLDEAREASKHSRKLGRVMRIVAAHHIQKMRDLLAFEKVATWRRMNGFDRVVDGEDDWFHGPRSLPQTPQEFNASLRSDLQKLKDTISMPRQKVSNLINALEQSKVSDEEFAVLKRLVEKRGREATRVTVTPVATVQYCSPSPQTSEPSPDVCFELESNKGKMDPKLKELESSSAGTGLETPGQQCPPNEGTWKTGRTTADGFLTAGVGSNQGGSIYSPTERVDTRASTKSTTTTADITFLQQSHKPKDEDEGSEENKQFDPGGKGEKAPLWNAALTLCFYWGKRWAVGGSLLVLRVFRLCFVCACLFCSLNYYSF